MKCFLDMDGVITDWDKGAHAVNNIERVGDKWPYTRGPKGWDFFADDLGYTPSRWFEKMGFDFWAGLEWMPDGKQIFSLCEALFGNNLYLLTAPNIDLCPRGAVDGRLKWIKRELPWMVDRTLVGSCKHACANGYDCLLVDDYDKNIGAWEDGGGRGFLLPRPWNTKEHLAYGETPTLLLNDFLKRIRL